MLQKEYRELHNTRVTREQTINIKLKEQEKYAALLKAEQDAFNETKATLIKIHEVKVNYPMKAKILSQVTEDLNQYKVKVTNIAYTENNATGRQFDFALSAPTDKHITSLLEYMTKERGEEFDFALGEILYDTNTTNYTSHLKAVIQ